MRGRAAEACAPGLSHLPARSTRYSLEVNMTWASARCEWEAEGAWGCGCSCCSMMVQMAWERLEASFMRVVAVDLGVSESESGRVRGEPGTGQQHGHSLVCQAAAITCAPSSAQPRVPAVVSMSSTIHRKMAWRQGAADGGALPAAEHPPRPRRLPDEPQQLLRVAGLHLPRATDHDAAIGRLPDNQRLRARGCAPRLGRILHAGTS